MALVAPAAADAAEDATDVDATVVVVVATAVDPGDDPPLAAMEYWYWYGSEKIFLVKRLGTKRRAAAMLFVREMVVWSCVIMVLDFGGNIVTVRVSFFYDSNGVFLSCDVVGVLEL